MRVYFCLTVYLLFCAAQYLFGYYFWGQSSFSVGNDDAFISFRYAENLIAHGVLSYNMTDAPPVEGYSNPLYVLISALAFLVVSKGSVYPVMAFAGALVVACGLGLVSRHPYLKINQELILPTILLLALSPTLWIHGTSGLETAWVFFAQVSLWVCLLTYLDTSEKRYFAVVLIASIVLVLLRTDGFVFPVLSALYLLIQRRRSAAIYVVGTCIVTFLAIMALRHSYYQLYMPLPYYVKVSGALTDRLIFGAKLLWSISLKDGYLFPLMGILLAVCSWFSRGMYGKKYDLKSIDYEVFCGCGLLTYYLVIGGDIYRERFLLILLPMGLIALWRAIQVHNLSINLITAVICLQQLSAFVFDPRLQYTYTYPKYDRAVALGEFLAENHPKATLATGTAGKPAFFSGLKTIDMLGLNDRHIAFVEPKLFIPGHSKFDPDYVFSLKPDLICSHVFKDGSLAYGMNKSAYDSEGYSLAYLVRDRGVEGPEIVIPEETNSDDVGGLVENGYSFGCVLRANTH